MSKLNFAMFMAGVTVGSVAAWLALKKHYEQIAQKEIDSVKATFSGKTRPTPFDAPSDKETSEEIAAHKQKANMAKLKPDLVNYAAKLQEEGYTNYTAHSEKNDKKEAAPMIEKPYIISPEEYGEIDGYATLSLTYYSDETLANDDDEIVDDVENSVGTDFADHFGDYEDDSVFVRNERLKCDYEILRDNRSYTEVTGRNFDQED